MHSYRGLIFDLDHTLVQTTPVWRAAEHALLARMGSVWTDDLSLLVRGMNVGDLAALVHARVPSPLSVQECRGIMRDALLFAYRSARIEEIPGAKELVRRLHGRVPMAVASGSPREGIGIALDQLGIRNLFDVVLSSDEVPRGKPWPDVFIAAAAALGVPAGDCLVFEDSRHGVDAARAAGMDCFVVPSPDQFFDQCDGVTLFDSWHAVQVTDVFPEPHKTSTP